MNFIRQSRTLHHTSAYTQRIEKLYFNRTPLSPTCTRVIIHNRLNDRTLWATHGEDGCYIRPDIEHYRCHKAYIPKTRAEIISDTVEPLPEEI